MLTDLGLPDTDGFEVARAIRAMAGRQGRLALVGLTARVMPHEHDDCRLAGIDDVVIKPVDPPLLLAAPRRALVDSSTPAG